MKNKVIINSREIKISVQGKKSNRVWSTSQLSKAQHWPDQTDEDPDTGLTTTVHHLNKSEDKKTETLAGASG